MSTERGTVLLLRINEVALAYMRNDYVKPGGMEARGQILKLFVRLPP